jgi:hypothetical protein
VKTFILIAFFLSSLSVAQNRLYVRVEYNPSMQLLGFGGSGFFYDHVLLLPDGTAFRFDDVSEGFEQVLPSGIMLATATAADLANAGGTQGTYQDDGATVQTSFGVSFASGGEKYSSVMDESGYMFIPPLQPSFITGEYNNFSATVIGGGLTNTPQVSAADANNYYFYGDGKFGFEESSGVSSDAGNVATTFSEEGSAAGSFLFEGYNLFLTYNDGTQAVLPAYLWPPYQPFVDQILMVGEDEFLNEEEGSLPIQLLPATGAVTQQNPLSQNSAQNPLQNNQTQNPLAQPAQTTETNPLAQPQNDSTNPLSQPTEQNTNPLGTPQSETSSGNALTGTVTPPAGMTLSNALVIACPYESAGEADCINTVIDASGTYSLALPAGDYIVMAAMDATGDGQVNTGDFVGYQSFSSTGEAQTLDFVLQPYTE